MNCYAILIVSTNKAVICLCLGNLDAIHSVIGSSEYHRSTPDFYFH